LQGIVSNAICGVIAWSSAENGEFAVHVAIDEWEERERWEKDL
jgi:hypothetical protein